MPRLTLTRLLAGLSALVVLPALATVPASPATASPSLPALPVSTIAWGPCSDQALAARELQCADLTVPLDHADPSAGTITLALSRRQHTASDFKGSILVNPGGPGGSGRSLATLGQYVPGGVGDSYDWIGFDPRGVGGSSPSLHCTQSYFGVDRPSYVPRTPRLTRYWLRKSQAYADACAATATQRALLPHLTTLDSVQDMESIRQALGESVLNYYGFSYGTYLGQVYATTYPSHVGRFVLDGVVDPQRTWYAANLDQERAFDANMDVYWAYLAHHPGAFHLGTSAKRIKRGYYRELRLLARHPAAHRQLGPDELTDAMLTAGYYVFDWNGIGRDYSALVRKHQGAGLFQRYHDGSMGDDNGFAIYNAVQCTDAAWPGFAQQRNDAWWIYRHAPFLAWGNTWYNSPCLFWHAPSHTPVSVSGAAVTAPVLLISETRDAATPYSGAVTVRSLFPTSALVAGINGTTHAGSLSGVACVDDTVAAYLDNGTLPARAAGNGPDRSCPAVAPPPVGSGARQGARASEREALMAAQAPSLG